MLARKIAASYAAGMPDHELLNLLAECRSAGAVVVEVQSHYVVIFRKVSLDSAVTELRARLLLAGFVYDREDLSYARKIFDE